MPEFIHVYEVVVRPAAPTTAEQLRVTVGQLRPMLARIEIEDLADGDRHLFKGITEEDLDLAVYRLKEWFGLTVECEAPTVTYRAVLTRPVQVDATHAVQVGGAGRFARVKIRFTPRAPRAGMIFENATVGGAVPESFVAGVLAGLTKAAQTLRFFTDIPLRDFKASLIDGAYHDADSDAATFETAAMAAFGQIEPHALVVVEPLLFVEVTTPDEFMGGIIGDLNARRGQVESTSEAPGNRQCITARVPAANLWGYYNRMMSLTNGRGVFNARFDRYEPVPVWQNDPDPKFPGAAAKRA